MAHSDNTTEITLNEKTKNDLLLVKLESICNWEQFLEPAPTTIAILGQLMSIATTKDFSLNKTIPEGGFKYVHHPSSFRACLLQICNCGCDAFLEAHKNMDKIRMYTVQIQQNVIQAVTILEKDTKVDKTEMLSSIFEEMKDDVLKCLKLAAATETKFSNVVLLVNETSEASAASKGVYEDGLMEAVERIKLLQFEEKQIKTRKLEMKEEKMRVLEEVAKAKTMYEKSVEQLPGIGTLLLMATADEGIKMATGAIQSLGQYKIMTAAGAWSVVTSLLKKEPKDISETSPPEKQSGNQTEKDSQNQAKLKAFQHANEINECVEKMYGMFQEKTDLNGKHEMKVDLDEHKNTLKEIKDNLIRLKNDYKKSEFAKDPAVLGSKKTCKTVIIHCEEILKLKKKNADKLFKKIEKLRSETNELKQKANTFLEDSAMSMASKPKLQTEQDSNSRKMFEKYLESKKSELKLQKKELDDTRAAWEKLKDDNRIINEEQNSVLERLSNTKIESINFREIQKTLRDGLIVLSRLKKQWTLLIVFFENITNVIEVCLQPDTNKMITRLRHGGHSLCLSRDVILKMAPSVQYVAYGIQLIATAYTDISKKHLVPNTASLGELIAFDPVQDSQKLKQRRKQIDEDCKKAKAEIQQLAHKTRKDMDQKIESINRQLNEQLQQPNPSVQEIAENVEK